MCDDVFHNDDGKYRGFPKGCAECTSTIEWDCYHEDDGDVYVCPWRENHWKYDEVKGYLLLAKAQDGGLNLNRLPSLSFVDFIKVNIVKGYIPNAALRGW